MSRVINWAADLRVGSVTRKAVLLVLAKHADATTWQTIAGQERIAEQAEVSSRSVRTALSDLEAVGIIHRERRHRRDGSRTSDRITLNRFWQPPGEAAADPIETTDTPHLPEAASGRRPPEPPTPDPPPTGNSRHTYRKQLPGLEEQPVGPPENPLLTVVDQLTSRGMSRRPDERSRSRPPRRPPDTEPRVHAACQLLAARDLDDRRRAWLTQPDLARVRNDQAWHTEATRRRLEHDGPKLGELAAADPRASARQLADHVEHEPPVVDVDPWGVGPPAALVIDLRPPSALLAAQAAAADALHRARQETA